MLTKSELLNGLPYPVFLMRCRTDFKFFAENLCRENSSGEKVTIQPYQLKWVEAIERNRRTIVESGTRSGKTEVIGALYPLWKMFCNKNFNVLLISKTMEQSTSNLLFRIKYYIENNEILSEMMLPEDRSRAWNSTEILTKHSCNVKNLPYNDHIRGFGASLIICDEIDSYEDTNIFFEHVLSRLGPSAKLVGISTPVGPTRIIGLLKEKNDAKILRGWEFLKTPYLVDEQGLPAKIEHREDILKYRSIWPDRWSVQELYNMWEQGKANWMRNIMCVNIGEVDDAIFPVKYIESSFDYKLGFSQTVNHESMYFIGIDLCNSEGPRSDFDAYVVIEKTSGFYIIRWIETGRSLDPQPKINRIHELYKTYFSNSGTYVSIDKSQCGPAVIKGLQSLGVPVSEGSFHSIGRAQLYQNLSAMLASGRIVIPRNPDSDDECVRYSQEMLEQMTGFKRSKSSKTGKDFIDSRAKHDDIVAATALAMSEAVEHEEMELSPMTC